MQPTRGWAGRPYPPIWPCSGWGLTAAASPRTAVSSYLTISPLSHNVRRYVSVSLSVTDAPKNGGPWALPSTLPGGARTFLSAEAQRPPGPPTLPPQIYHVHPTYNHHQTPKPLPSFRRKPESSLPLPAIWVKVEPVLNLSKADPIFSPFTSSPYTQMSF